MNTTKLIVAIRSPSQMKERRKAVRESWGKAFVDHGAEVFFVVSGEAKLSNSELRGDVLHTPGTNTHGDLTNRMCWLWRHLSKLSYSHVLVMDDDCSVNVPLFMTLQWNKAEAWGHNSGYYLSGCAAVYSSNTIKKLAYHMSKDDVVIGALLTQLKIKMEHAGTPCFIRPWKPKPNTWKFGDPDVAIQHYVRSAGEIMKNHSKIKKKTDAQEIKFLKNIKFIRVKALPEEEFGSHTSKIYVDKNKKYILKELIKHKEHDLIKREAYVLNLLNSRNFIWAPKLIHSEDGLLITERCGERVNEKNIPSNYKIQAKKILQDLKKLNIKHNDIKKSEILINSGVICLCDFGWASINNDYSCGIGISNKKKIHGIFPDEGIIKILDNVYDKKIKKISTSYRRNKSGSQSEQPKITIEKNLKTIKVSGYQMYNISIKDKKIQYLNRVDKYRKIRNILSSLRPECVSLVDIGCSSGIISYTANELGYSPIFSLDHDQEYLNIMNQINTKLSIGSVHVEKFSFGDPLPRADVMTMGALIHWVYSCTALYGSFDKIFSYLNSSIDKYLIIEWIDNNDAAIKSFKHTAYNKSIHVEQYNKGNFKNSLEKNIGNITAIKPVSPTRELYVVKKSIPLPKPLQLS